MMFEINCRSLLLKGYVVEKCEDDGLNAWEPVPGVVQGNSIPVKNLKEGKKYKFRVRPENAFGVGKPLESETVTAKNPFGRFMFCFGFNVALKHLRSYHDGACL